MLFSDLLRCGCEPSSFVFYAFFALKIGNRRGRPWVLTAKDAKDAKAAKMGFKRGTLRIPHPARGSLTARRAPAAGSA